MTEQEIQDQIYDYVANDYSNGTRVFSADDGLLENGIIDSLGLIGLVTFLEKNFAILIHDDDVDLDNFESISSLTRFIANKLQQ